MSNPFKRRVHRIGKKPYWVSPFEIWLYKLTRISLFLYLGGRYP